MSIQVELVHLVPGRARFRIGALKDAPALAEAFAERLSAVVGIRSVRVNCACASLVVEYDPAIHDGFLPQVVMRKLRAYRFDPSKLPRNGNGKHKREGVKPVLGNIILPVAALGATTIGFLPSVVSAALVGVAVMPVFRRAGLKLLRERKLGVDMLDAASIAVLAAQRSLPTCALMASLIGIGEHIRLKTAQRAEKAVCRLIELGGASAKVLRGRRLVRVPVKSLKPGDKIVAHAGDVVPVDGVVLRGTAGVSESMVTGESRWCGKQPGDTVCAGSVALDGEIVVEARATGVDTKLGKIMEMLRTAPVHDTRIQDYAARFADRLVFPTFALSAGVYAISRNVARALSILIVDFGTGIRVGTPTAFVSHMMRAARRRVVFKSGRAMENLARVDTIVFDKTGTLTTGQPDITDIIALNGRLDERGVLRCAAAAEDGLNHPIARAVVAKARQMGLRIPARKSPRLQPGLGVSAEVEGREIRVGSERLLRAHGIDTSPAADVIARLQVEGKSAACVAWGGKICGIIGFSDRLRPEAARVIAELKRAGVDNFVIATGDRTAPAAAASCTLGVAECVAEVMPEEKMRLIKELRSKGHVVAVVGDGINDSLALVNADVGIAPLSATDAAKEAADVLLMEDDLGLLVEAYVTAKYAEELAKQNLGIVAVPNAVAVVLAAMGLLGPAAATFVNNGSTVAAGLNSLRPILADDSDVFNRNNSI
ncbi:MAG: heavy metal translocating P-type ATPase [Armatimonadetes bacterium]|nr:heavy metal translocating P-type ATPase [Armatimonadota bacterium]